MRKKLTVLFIILISFALRAERPEISIWTDIRNSAYTAENNLHIRTEVVNLPAASTFLYHLVDNEWVEEQMSQLIGSTLEGIISADPAISQYCRFKTVLDTMVAMMPAYVPADIFPPVWDQLSFIGEDPQGDSLMAYNVNLDITSSYFGFSDTRFYSSIENLTGQYPTDSGGIFPSEYYFYIHGIVNPENVLQDSVAYGLVYVNIPFLFGPGLYKINGTEINLDNIELIDDIEVEIVDGKMILACDIESITADEDFGDWPSLSNSLGVDVLTGALALPLDFSINDYAMPSLQFIDQYVIEPFVNVLPQITNIDFSIEELFTQVTLDYLDENGNFPLIADLITDSGTYEMIPGSFDFNDLVEFSGVITETQWDQFTIRFSDNGYEFTEITVYNTGSGDNTINSRINVINTPNPFNPETRFDYNLVEETRVSILIFNLKGQLVESIDNGFQPAGYHSCVLNFEDQPSGIYFYKLVTENRNLIRKMILTK